MTAHAIKPSSSSIKASIISSASPEEAVELKALEHELMLGQKVQSHFEVPWYAILNILAMAFIAFHLNLMIVTPVFSV